MSINTKETIRKIIVAPDQITADALEVKVPQFKGATQIIGILKENETRIKNEIIGHDVITDYMYTEMLPLANTVTHVPCMIKTTIRGKFDAIELADEMFTPNIYQVTKVDFKEQKSLWDLEDITLEEATSA